MPIRLPRIDEMLDSLNGAARFTTLDVQSGYWHIAVRDSDKEKTAFISHMGLFEFNVMPFGLCSASATFQRLMQGVLAGLTGKCCLVFIDDINIYTTGSAWQHMADIICVLEKIRESGMKLKGKKCCFATSKIKLLGFIVSKSGIEPDPEKIEIIEIWAIPTNRKAVKSFLGAIGFYPRCVNDFAMMAGRLTELLRKDSKLVWGDSQVAAFLALKKALKNHPVMAYPRLGEPFKLYTDASITHIGAVLNHADENGIERTVAYWIKILNRHQKNYAVSERECI